MLTDLQNPRDLPEVKPRWMTRALRMEWLGQTTASLAWIASVFSYGISEPGDWLQPLAASAWFISNIATLSNRHAP